MMTVEEAISYIHSGTWHENKPGLVRIGKLLEKMGNPQKDLRYIHVAGTNAKGSFCAMMASILQSAGYKTGLYTSPYIRKFQERIQINGKMIDDNSLTTLAEVVQKIEIEENLPLTVFERITAIAFAYYKQEKVDVVVLEVGLGGRLDPTNIIESPLLSVITYIDFDHMEQLGNTIQEISLEKAGIIKENCPCLYGGRENSASTTISAICKMRHAPFYKIDRTAYHVKEMTLNGTIFDFNDDKDIFLPLLGLYQPFNSAMVLSAVNILNEKTPLKISKEAMREGLKNVRWPARFEKINESPLVIFDGGHNPNGVQGAVRSVETYFPEQKVNILTGVLRDKDFDEMVELLHPIANKVYCVTPQSARALPAKEYADIFAMHNMKANSFESVKEGLLTAIEESKKENIPLICLGSLYLYNSVMSVLEESR